MVVRLWNHREWRHGRETMEPPGERSPGLGTTNSALRAGEVRLEKGAEPWSTGRELRPRDPGLEVELAGELWLQLAWELGEGSGVLV